MHKKQEDWVQRFDEALFGMYEEVRALTTGNQVDHITYYVRAMFN